MADHRVCVAALSAKVFFFNAMDMSASASPDITRREGCGHRTGAPEMRVMLVWRTGTPPRVAERDKVAEVRQPFGRVRILNAAASREYGVRLDGGTFHFGLEPALYIDIHGDPSVVVDARGTARLSNKTKQRR